MYGILSLDIVSTVAPYATRTVSTVLGDVQKFWLWRVGISVDGDNDSVI